MRLTSPPALSEGEGARPKKFWPFSIGGQRVYFGVCVIDSARRAQQKQYPLFKFPGWQYLSWNLTLRLASPPALSEGEGARPKKFPALFYWQAESLHGCIYN